MSSIADEKKLKRQEFMQRRRNMSAMEHLVLDGSVCARILSLPEFAAADLISLNSHGEVFLVEYLKIP